VLANQKCAVLELSGRQVGLMARADLSGLAITLKEWLTQGMLLDFLQFMASPRSLADTP
jgi:hypothetical protein